METNFENIMAHIVASIREAGTMFFMYPPLVSTVRERPLRKRMMVGKSMR